VLRRLTKYFHAIPEAQHIEHVTLHYLDGHIYVELQLPLFLATRNDAVHVLRQRFEQAVKTDPNIGSIELYFH